MKSSLFSRLLPSPLDPSRGRGPGMGPLLILLTALVLPLSAPGVSADEIVVVHGGTGQTSSAPMGTGFTAIAAGYSHGYALAADGSIEAWGSDSHEQVSKTPTGTGFTAIAGGNAHGYALAANGSIEAWGDDGQGQVSNAPTDTGYTAIAAGWDHGYALRANGSIAAWGGDSRGQVSNTPMGMGFTAIAAGAGFGYALAADGSIAAWGGDDYGQDPNNGQVSKTPTGTGFTAIAAGFVNGYALAADGSIAAWGADDFGQVFEAPKGPGFTAIAASHFNGCALAADGSITVWGTDSGGQVSNSPAGTDFTAIAAGGYHAYALRLPPPPWHLDRIDQAALPLDGVFSADCPTGTPTTVYIVGEGIDTTLPEFGNRASAGWGSSTDLGAGISTAFASVVGGSIHGVDKTAKLVSVQILSNPGGDPNQDAIDGLQWIRSDHQLVGGNAVVCWPLFVNGPFDPGLLAEINLLMADGLTFVAPAGHFSDACAITPWGPDAIVVGATDQFDAKASFSNDGPCVDLFAPGVDIETSSGTYPGTQFSAAIAAGAASLWLRVNGAATPAAVKAGLLADATPGVVTNIAAGSPNLLLHVGACSTPCTTGGIEVWAFDQNSDVVTLAPFGTDFIQVAAGFYHCLALRANGSIAAWADGPNANVMDSPGGFGFLQVVAGRYHSLALTADGSIEAWGVDQGGVVNNAPTESGFTQVAAGQSHSLALRADGSILPWGSDSDGNITEKPEGLNFTWVGAGFYHSLALTADGSIESWGWTHGTPPIGSGFVQVAGGGYHSVALHGDGSIKTWGIGPAMLSNPPAGQDFTQIAAGEFISLALRADGSMEVWGDDQYDMVSSAPVGKDFIHVAGAGLHALALRAECPSPSSWTDEGSGLAGVNGEPLFVGSGDLTAGSLNPLELSNAAPSALSALFLASSSTPTPFYGGTLMTVPWIQVFYRSTSPTGEYSAQLVMPAGLPSGTELWLQWAVTDAAAIQGVSLSNAIKGVTP